MKCIHEYLSIEDCRKFITNISNSDFSPSNKLEGKFGITSKFVLILMQMSFEFVIQKKYRTVKDFNKQLVIKIYENFFPFYRDLCISNGFRYCVSVKTFETKF